jgi:hypothetical protein
MSVTISAGGKWVAKSGEHKEAQVVVERATGNTIQVRVTEPGRSGGKQKRYALAIGRAEFLAKYVPYGALETADSFGGGGSFRKATNGATKVVARPPVVAPPPDGLLMEIMQVTPAQAAAWLEHEGLNRKLRNSHVERLAQAMLRGEWRMTGEAIKLGRDGTLRDGQHRLAAIVRSGVPITTLVIRGVEEDAFDVMDSGAKRDIADALHLHGYSSPAGLAAVVRLLMLYERFGRVDANNIEARAVISAPNTLRYLREHPEVQEVIGYADAVRHAGLQGGVSLWGCALVLFWRIDQAATVTMAGYLSAGAGLERHHPLLVLRNRAISPHAGRFSKSQQDRQELLALVIKAWNAWRRGEQISQLSYRGDRLPPIEGAAAQASA